MSRISTLIEDCRSLGVRFSLDDFGTGYSSLTYLRRLPASVLKIDQSFVRDMLWDPDDLAIVEGVIGLAAAFRRTVIAEGVEDIEHILTLLELGCDVMQGYAIARPMPAQRLEEWLAGFQPDPRWLGRRQLPQPPRLRTVAGQGHPPLLATAVLTAYQNPESGRGRNWDPGLCRLATWFDESGRRYCSELDSFHRFHEAHREVHRRAQVLHRQAQAGGGDPDKPLAEFNAACQELQHILTHCNELTRPY
jgi:hypothetical protein